MATTKIIGMAGLGLGLALASGCMTRGSASFGGAGELEPDMTIPTGENPMPAMLAPQQPGNVIYPTPQPEKKPEYWQQHNDPYAELAQGRPYVGQGFTIAPPVNAAKKGASTYVVKQGDIFGTVAKNHGVTIAALKAANPGIDYDKIKAGQKLKLPGKASAATAAAPASSGAATATKTQAKAIETTAPASVTVDLPKLPEIPEEAVSNVKESAAKVETSAKEAAEAAKKAVAEPETTVYLANGEEDLFTIAVNRTMGIAQLMRLNPNLEASPTKILPAGTPVIVPAGK